MIMGRARRCKYVREEGFDELRMMRDWEARLFISFVSVRKTEWMDRWARNRAHANTLPLENAYLEPCLSCPRCLRVP